MSKRPHRSRAAVSELDRLTHRSRFIDAVREGIADVQAGRTISDDELGRRVAQRYGMGKKR